MWYFKNAKQVDHISLHDRAFHYGDGCFTTARFTHNCFELKQRHLHRLETTCAKMQLHADLSLIEQSLLILRSLTSELHGTLKIMISRGESQRGYRLPEQTADVYVYFYPQTEAISLQLQRFPSGVLNVPIGLSMPNLVGLKTLNRLEQIVLRQVADQSAWIEALVTDIQGYVVEGVSSNCFLRINDTWITPELRYNGVHGVMRAEILQRMQSKHIFCESRVVEIDEIGQIQSLFFCNALHPMQIASSLGEQNLDVGACLELFETLQLNQIYE